MCVACCLTSRGPKTMPPTRATLKSWGWSDAKIDAVYQAEKDDDARVRKFMAEHPDANMLDILEIL